VSALWEEQPNPVYAGVGFQDGMPKVQEDDRDADKVLLFNLRFWEEML
jgi:hypothetical protein